ncbi:hypothetical protein WJX73_008713 [Symbiochloris irregularis]|uniref:RCC1-like domain-containing protein n=1 Tax=Symbiochloris irregularis TaxID=706552 RepID=A0AAW1NRH6_9CHLO
MSRRLLACWGSGDYGRLGFHGTSDVPKLVASSLLESLQSVTCGASHTCAVTDDGSVITWGLNNSGQLGHSAAAAHSQDLGEVLIPEAVTQASAGFYHTLCVAESGNVWSMGSNARGQLGLGKDLPGTVSPRLIKALLGVKVAQVAAGSNHSLAVSESGEVFTWGQGSEGQLGHGQAAFPRNRDEFLPRSVASISGNRALKVSSVCAGHSHSGCVGASGEVHLWGSSSYGQLGCQTPEHICSHPQEVRAHSVSQVACGGYHTLALQHGGQVIAWGLHHNGVLGLGRDHPSSTTYTPTPIKKLQASQIACGWRHSLALTAGGGIVAWGWGGSVGSDSVLSGSHTSCGGQLGLGNEFDFWDPTPVPVLHGQGAGEQYQAGVGWKALQVACGFNHSAAVVDIL